MSLSCKEEKGIALPEDGVWEVENHENEDGIMKEEGNLQHMYRVRRVGGKDESGQRIMLLNKLNSILPTHFTSS